MNLFEASGWKIGSLFGVDISLSLGFLLVVGINVVFAGPYVGIVFAVALLVSLIIHEMGHALVAKRYKLEPSILLHGFGGLCFHRTAQTDGQDAFIVVMGPIAQIVAGLAVYGLAQTIALPKVAADLASYFVWISILWGSLNLFLPIYPLDGGKLLHLILRRFIAPDKALRYALYTSIGVSVPLGIFALTQRWFIGAFLVMFLVMDNLNALKAGSHADPRPTPKKESSLTRELVDDASRAFDQGDFREAYRLCHQARSAGTMAEKTEKQMWEILTLASIEIGELDEAKGWLKRAPQTDRIKAATASLTNS